MEHDETWDRLWERIKTTAKVKSRNIKSDDDFADLHWTADEILDQDISDTLTEAAREIKAPPEPTRRYRTGSALEDYSEKVNRGHKGTRAVLGGMGGLWACGAGLALIGHPEGPTSIGILLGSGVAGSVAAGASDYVAAKGLQKSGELLKGEEGKMQQTAREGSYPSIISNRLSDRENDVYGFKAFRDDGIETTELADGEELYDFLRDMNVEAETDWRVKRKDGHPLQVIGITATYGERHDHTYDRRNRIAEEVAEEDNVPVEEVLDVGGDGATPVPTESDYKEGEQTYEFVIVDTNPEHSYEMENDFMDYSEVLGIEEETEFEELGREKIKES